MFPLGMLAVHSKRGLIRSLSALASNCLTTFGCALARIVGCALARMHMASTCLRRLQGFMPRGWALAQRRRCFLATAVAVMVVSATLPLPLLLAMPTTAGGQLVAESCCTVPCCHGECVAANEATTTPGWSLYPTLEVHLPVQGLEIWDIWLGFLNRMMKVAFRLMVLSLGSLSQTFLTRWMIDTS